MRLTGAADPYRQGLLTGLNLASIALLTALGLASLWARADLHGVLGAALALLMLAIARSDLREFVIPDRLSFTALALGLADAAIGAGGRLEAELSHAALRAVIAAGALWIVRWSYRRWRGREGIGLGDVKLAAVAGAWLSTAWAPIAFEIAALSALVAYAARQYSRRRALSGRALLPFGLFLAPSIWLCWFLMALAERFGLG